MIAAIVGGVAAGLILFIAGVVRGQERGHAECVEVTVAWLRRTAERELRAGRSVRAAALFQAADAMAAAEGAPAATPDLRAEA